MRKIFLLFILLLSITFVRAQILIDNGPLKDPNAIVPLYELSESKWNKTNLTYYINNTSAQGSESRRWESRTISSTASVPIPPSAFPARASARCSIRRPTPDARLSRWKTSCGTMSGRRSIAMATGCAARKSTSDFRMV